MQETGENGTLCDAAIHFGLHTAATFQGGWGEGSSVQVAVEMNMGEVDLHLDGPAAKIVRLMVLTSSLMTGEAMVSWTKAFRGLTSLDARQGKF